MVLGPLFRFPLPLGQEHAFSGPCALTTVRQACRGPCTTPPCHALALLGAGPTPTECRRPEATGGHTGAYLGAGEGRVLWAPFLF